MDVVLSTCAAITILFNLVIPVAAKYCTYDVDGELKYYICPRNEYCCNFGCCLSPTFQFYQLWYYWLMVIFMFLLCSGGGWWYRYWLQGRYGPELGTPMPPPSSRLHSHHLSHRPARVSYHPSRDAVVLHHIWKPRGLGSSFPHASPPPSYACAQRATTVSLPHETSQASSGLTNVIGTVGSKTSPYYQLYGPPPPYEAVVHAQHQAQEDPITISPANESATQQRPHISMNNSLAETSVSNATAAMTISLPISNDTVSSRAQQSSVGNSNSNQNAV